MLTETAAWREIARRIVEGEWENDGLCHEVYRLHWLDDSIPWATYSRMIDRINQNLPSAGGYAYPRGKEPGGRALAALLFVEQMETENPWSNR